MSAGRGWAYLGVTIGAAASVAANVAHSYVPPEGTPDGWTPQPGAVIGAVFWPVALLVAIEMMARVDWPTGQRWVLLRFGGLIPVATVAAVVSYRHMSGLLGWYRDDPLTATIGPLAVDGLMVMAAGALIATAPLAAKVGTIVPTVVEDRLPGLVAEAVAAAVQPVSLYMPLIPERPEDGVAVVYRLYAEDGDLLYVGCTISPAVRLRSHQRRQPWWDEVTDSEVIWYPSIGQAADVEAEAIRSERPIYNVGMARYAFGLTPPVAPSVASVVAAPEPEPASVVAGLAEPDKNPEQAPPVNGNGQAVTKVDEAVAVGWTYESEHGRRPSRVQLAELANCSTGTAQKALARMTAGV